MKRIGIIIIAGAVLLSCLFYSRTSDIEDFYCTYTFEKISYLSPLSSSTIDYMNERMTGTEYTIQKDLFKIETLDNTVEISSPNYMKQEVPNNLSSLSNVYASTSADVKYQYTIYNKDGNKTNWRLYVSPDSVWLGSYVDNTANGSEIIMYIYKLSK